jgi:L-iditol 2-dehydrogenase
MATAQQTAHAASSNYQLIFTGKGSAELRPGTPPPLQAGQLLLRTRVSLISPGTERAWFLGLSNTPGLYPQPAGYSNIGEVTAVAPGVQGWQIGERVASPTHHAAYIAADAAHCVPVPKELPDESAAFFNLGSIALQAIRKARIELGESVAVIGAGLVGLLAAQLARLTGALPAVSIDQEPSRLLFAQQVGIDATLPAGDSTLAMLSALTGQAGADVVIEATGHPQAILSAFALARPHGRVVLLGSTRGETENVNFYSDIHKKGLTVIGAHNATRPQVDSYPGWWTQVDDQRTVLRLLEGKRLLVEPLITHRFDWQVAPQAYELLKSWDLKALGMLLDWRDTRQGKAQ